MIRKIAVFLDNWHWALLLVAAPFLLFPSPRRSLALLIVPAVWLIAWLARREPLPRTPLNVSLLVMFVMVLVSLWATYDLAFSLPKVAGMVLGIGIFFAFVRIGSRARGWWLTLLVFLGAGIGIAGLGLLSTNWLYKVNVFAPILSRLPARITGLPGAESGFSGNELAGALLWEIPVMLGLGAYAMLRAKRLEIMLSGRGRTSILFAIWGVAIFLVLGYFLLTQSRSGYIGFAVVVAIMLTFVLPARWRGLFVVLALLAAIAGIGFLFTRENDGLVTPLVEDVAGSSSLSLDTLKGRFELWSRALYAIQDFPFTGMGMNTFRQVVHVLYPLFFVGPDYDISHAHNEFLQAALDLGIPGLIAFIALYLGAFWMLREIWIASPRTPTPMLLRTLVLGFGGGLFAHIVYGMTDAVALGAKPGFLFWMLLGLIAVLFDQVRSGRIAEWEWWRRMESEAAG